MWCTSMAAWLLCVRLTWACPHNCHHWASCTGKVSLWHFGITSVTSPVSTGMPSSTATTTWPTPITPRSRTWGNVINMVNDCTNVVLWSDNNLQYKFLHSYLRSVEQALGLLYSFCSTISGPAKLPRQKGSLWNSKSCSRNLARSVDYKAWNEGMKWNIWLTYLNQ